MKQAANGNTTYNKLIKSKKNVSEDTLFYGCIAPNKTNQAKIDFATKLKII